MESEVEDQHQDDEITSPVVEDEEEEEEENITRGKMKLIFDYSIDLF